MQRWTRTQDPVSQRSLANGSSMGTVVDSLVTDQTAVGLPAHRSEQYEATHRWTSELHAGYSYNLSIPGVASGS